MVAGPPDVTSAHCDTRVAASSRRGGPSLSLDAGEVRQANASPTRYDRSRRMTCPAWATDRLFPKRVWPAYVASLTRGWELGSEGVRGFWGRGMIRGWRLYADRSCLEYPLCKK